MQKIEWDSLPVSVQGPLRRYYEFGNTPGDFLEAVLRGDLYGCIARCSPALRPHLADIAIFVASNFPAEAMYDDESIRSWERSGGARGNGRKLSTAL